VRCQQFGGGDLLLSLLPFTMSDSLSIGTLGSPGGKTRVEIATFQQLLLADMVDFDLLLAAFLTRSPDTVSNFLSSRAGHPESKVKCRDRLTKEDKRSGSSRGFFRQRRDLEEKT
jgi:hypothetical protein